MTINTRKKITTALLSIFLITTFSTPDFILQVRPADWLTLTFACHYHRQISMTRIAAGLGRPTERDSEGDSEEGDIVGDWECDWEYDSEENSE